MTKQFVDAATALSPEALALAFDRMVDLRTKGGKEASRAAVPSAAENSELDHRIRAALRPRTDELNAHLAGLHFAAGAAIFTAARAILKGRNLTAEQFDVLVRPFVGSGAVLPPHSPPPNR
ncbi:hypothetical protein OHB07_38130 [Streptomyces sp. NBC_00111]|uniref:hypothetical protein n=1 Tax=unclassified Streptomyces TaxID=2593676 RepID=UPI002E31FCF3|nr:hypothetical protein [Streptomyces sp. NBC_01460]